MGKRKKILIWLLIAILALILVIVNVFVYTTEQSSAPPRILCEITTDIERYAEIEMWVDKKEMVINPSPQIKAFGKKLYFLTPYAIPTNSFSADWNCEGRNITIKISVTKKGNKEGSDGK